MAEPTGHRDPERPDARGSEAPEPEPPAQRPLARLGDAARSALIAAGVGALVWTIVPVTIELMLNGKRWPAAGVFVPMMGSFLLIGLILSGMSAFVERLLGAERCSGLGALMVSGFVFGGAAVVVKTIAVHLDSLPSAARPGDAAGGTPLADMALASLVALPFALTVYGRLTRMSIGQLLVLVAVGGHIWFLLVAGIAGSGAAGRSIGLFLLALIQPGVLGLADVADGVAKPADAPPPRKRRAPIPSKGEHRKRKKREVLPHERRRWTKVDEPPQKKVGRSGLGL